MSKSAAELQELLASFPPDAPSANQTRLYRAVRWLARAEESVDDPDVQFILLWITFNALYADDLRGVEETFHGRIRQFFDQVVDLDTTKELHSLIWTTFSNSVRVLLDNKYAYNGFWKDVSGRGGQRDWSTDFVRANQRARDALGLGKTSVVLEVVFERLYTIRNQLVHGGATYQSSVNRAQVLDGARILASVVPVILELVMRKPYGDFGAIMYPVVD
jgi:hypothetical protein